MVRRIRMDSAHAYALAGPGSPHASDGWSRFSTRLRKQTKLDEPQLANNQLCIRGLDFVFPSVELRKHPSRRSRTACGGRHGCSWNHHVGCVTSRARRREGRCDPADRPRIMRRGLVCLDLHRCILALPETAQLACIGSRQRRSARCRVAPQSGCPGRIEGVRNGPDRMVDVGRWRSASGWSGRAPSAEGRSVVHTDDRGSLLAPSWYRVRLFSYGR